MRIGSKSENEFFLKLNERNEIIQENFLKLISNATKTVDTKVMLGDSTVKDVNTFDHIVLNTISIALKTTTW